MAAPIDISRKRRRRILLVAALALLFTGAAGTFYAIRTVRHNQHVQTLKPRGLDHLEKGEYVQALHLLGGYVGKHPNDLEVLRGLAEARLNVYDPSGRHVTQTIGILRRVLRQAPDDEAAQRQLLDLYVTAGFNTEAVAAADALLERHPDDPEALRGKANALYQMRAYDRAFEAADQYTQLEPEDIELQLLTLSIMHARDRRDRALLSRAQALVDAHPDDGRFLMVLGRAHQIVGQRDRARTLYDQAAEHLPPDADEIGRLARLMDEVGSWDRATDLLRDAENVMDDPMLVRLFVRRLWERSEHTALVERAAAFEFKSPRSDSEAMAVLALALLRAGRTAEVELAIEQLKRRRHDGLALTWASVLEVLASERQDPERLAEVAGSALLRHPNHPYFHFFRGHGFAGQGMTERAVESWTTAARLAPAWSAPLRRAAEAFLSTDRPTLAIELARGAIERMPNDAQATVTLLEAYASNLDQLTREQADQVTEMVERISAAAPAVQRRLLPLRVELRAASDQRDAAIDLLSEGLAVDPPLSDRVLLQLAEVSRRHDLGLTERCLAVCEQAWGQSPQLAVAQALVAAAQQETAQVIEGFDRAARAAGGQSPEADRAWALARARLLAALDSGRATDHWRDLVQRYAEDRRVLETAVKSSALWEDRALAAQAVRQLGELTREQNITWRIARARLLMAGGSVADRELAEASLLLLDVTREAPYLVEPRVLLAKCFERMDEPARALEMLERAYELAPHALSISLDRARLHQELGNADEAAAILSNLPRSGELNVSQRLQIALLLARRGDFDDAERMLQQVLSEHPDARGAKQLLANVYASQQRLDDAGALYDELLEQPDAASIEAAAGFYESRGEIERARRLLDRLDEMDVDVTGKALVRAAFHRRQNEPEQAMAVLVAATEQGEVRAQVWRQLIAMQLHADQIDAALASAERAAAAYPDEAGFTSLVQHREIVAAAAEQSLLKSLVGHILVDAPRRDVALETLQLLIDADREGRPMDEVALRLQRIGERHPQFLPLQNVRVRIYQRMNQDDDAVDLAVRTMRALPDRREAAWIAADALIEAERWSEALRVAQQLREQSGEQKLRADLIIAESQLRLGRGDAAIEQLRAYGDSVDTPEAGFLLLQMRVRALVQNDEVERARRMLQPKLSDSPQFRQFAMQWAVMHLPDAATAEQWLTDVATATPADAVDELVVLAQAWRGLDERFDSDEYTPQAMRILDQLTQREDAPAVTFELIGMIHDADGRPAAAMDAYRQALAKSPQLARSQNNLATLLLGEPGQAQEAVRLARGAVEQRPDVPAFQDTLALALLAAGHAEEAVQAAQRAVSLEPKRIEWYITLAEAFVGAGETEQVRELVSWLEGQLNPEAELPEDLAARLESLREMIAEHAAAY